MRLDSKELTILRLVQAFFTIIILGVTGGMIAAATAGNPAAVNFALFAGLWCSLALIVAGATAAIGRVRSVPPRLAPISMLGLDALATTICFIAAVVLSAQLGVHSCSDRLYTRTNKITNGAPNTASRCRSAQATTAFLWFNFAVFAASTAILVLVRRHEPVIQPSQVGSASVA